MNEKRRLKIAKRQLMMAQIARREARYALANALGEEERSGQTYDRVRDLLDEYEKRILDATKGTPSQDVKDNLAFVRSLQSMAEDASQAHKDASDQAQWQMHALAKAETRLDMQETRVDEEKRALADRREQGELTEQLAGSASGRSSMARKLQNSEGTGEEATNKGASSPMTTQP